MSKSNNRSFIKSTAKWATVVLATSAAVLSVQVYADRTQQVSETAVRELSNSVTKTQAPWSPAAGFADLIEQVSPAVVHVSVAGKAKASQQAPQFQFPPGSPFKDFFEEFQKRQQPSPKGNRKSRPMGIGSGFIISSDGLVVTNYHVIRGADEITVTLTDGEEYSAELKGTDSKTDLALLKLKRAKDLPFVPWGNDEQSRVGDWVLAIGNPFGLGGTATTGIISARGRDIRSGPYDDYIQVDAAINRGNSGGPLFNLRGEVIGINTAIYSPNGGSVGIGFAIPSSQAQNVIEQLVDGGEVERGWIGVQIQPLDEDLASGFGRDSESGALIASVVPGKPADKGGLKSGDIILEFNGEKVETMRDLPRIVAETKVGQSVPVKVWRNGKTKNLRVKTDRYPDDAALARVYGQEGDNAPATESDEALGATLAEPTPELTKRYKVSESASGIIVTAVEADGLAAENGLRVGDLIQRFDGRAVSSVEQVSSALEDALEAKKSRIVVLIQRSGRSLFIPFTLNEQ